MPSCFAKKIPNMKGLDKTNKFWETNLAGRWPGPVELHCIIPTFLTTVIRAYDPKKHPHRSEIEHESSLLHKRCCLCDGDLVDKPSLVGIRCLVSKFDAVSYVMYPDGKKSDEEPGFWYRSAFISTCFCFKCADPIYKFGSSNMFQISSDDKMIGIVLDHLEMTAVNTAHELQTINVSVNDFLELVLKNQNDAQLFLLKKLGKHEVFCQSCKKPNPKNRCGGCNFEHYCCSACSKKDWATHKPFCKWLREQKIFLQSKDWIKK